MGHLFSSDYQLFSFNNLVIMVYALERSMGGVEKSVEGAHEEQALYLSRPLHSVDLHGTKFPPL